MSYTLPNVSFPYYKFSIAGMDLVHSFKGGQGERPDYFAGLTHVRYADKANTATVNLTYVPTGDEDPNKIEKALADSQGKCTFQYGVAGYKSKTYRGLIYDYAPSFSEGVLHYTLSIVSEAVTYNFTTIQDESLCIKALEDRYVYKVLNGNSYAKKPLFVGDQAALAEYTKDQLSAGLLSSSDLSQLVPLLTSTLAASPAVIGPQQSPVIKEAVSVGSSEVLDIMSRIVSEYMGDAYEFDREGSDTNFKIGAGSVDVKGLSPIVALQKIAKNLIDNDNSLVNFYKIDISDNVEEGPKGKIRLKRTSQRESASYTFNWGSKDTNVLSWSPQYSGSVSIFGKSSLNHSTTVEVNPNENGEITTKMTVYSKPPADKIRNEIERQMANTNWDDDTLYSNTIENINWFHERVNYCYEASLEVLGVPDDLELTTSIVQVNPMINGRLHHSSGFYMVTGIEDSVDSRGFITKLKLAKITTTKDGQLMYQAPDGEYKVMTTVTKEDGTTETQTCNLVDYVPQS